MACFVQVEIYRIGVNCKRPTQLRNHKQMKSNVNFEMNSDLFFCEILNFHVPFICSVLKSFSDWQIMGCLINTVKHNITSFS